MSTIRPRPAAVNVTDAAILLGVSRPHIYKMIRDGVLQAHNVGGRTTRVRVDDLEALVGGRPFDNALFNTADTDEVVEA